MGLNMIQMLPRRSQESPSILAMFDLCHALGRSGTMEATVLKYTASITQHYKLYTITPHSLALYFPTSVT
jgi:hypothetical protein